MEWLALHSIGVTLSAKIFFLNDAAPYPPTGGSAVFLFCDVVFFVASAAGIVRRVSLFLLLGFRIGVRHGARRK